MDKSVDKTEFMRRFSDAIEKSGLQQIEIAEKLGVQDVTISRWKSGIRKPKGEYLGLFCKVVGVSPEWLLWGTNTRKNHSEFRFCPYCGKSLVKPIPEIDQGEPVCVVGNKREIASLMDEGEFEDFCRIWHETQKEFCDF